MKTVTRLSVLLTILLLTTTPLLASASLLPNNLSQYAVVENDASESGVLRLAYLIVYVFVYNKTSGLQPCEGANISIRGLSKWYSGTTDEYGMHLFLLKTPLFRQRWYIVKISATVNDHLITKTSFLHIKATQIQTKGFLLITR
ncbi:MAG: hypothetical protein JXA00_00755 [Candidatus Thermoplasmatota archaeon]|nr:hypothetical protein [Candidatus Thermoplasmatota archaeon]